VEVERAEQGFRGVGGGELARGDLAEGVDAAVGAAGPGDVEGFAKNLFESGFEGELDGGVGILALPAVEVGAAVGNRQLQGLEPKRS
jgi:hypothetical protein